MRREDAFRRVTLWQVERCRKGEMGTAVNNMMGLGVIVRETEVLIREGGS